MRLLKVLVLLFFVPSLVVSEAFNRAVAIRPSPQEPSAIEGGFVNQARAERFRHNGEVDDEGQGERGSRAGASEAPAGFDGQTNGFNEQGPKFDTINEDNVVPLRSFNDNRFIFEETETVSDGLGPTYNAQSCRECHQNVVTGGGSQVAEHRTGRLDNNVFFESLGGSLIQSRATHPDIMERVAFQDSIRTFRISTNTLGNGFVECIGNSTLIAIRDGQPESLRGTALVVPVLEAGSGARIGRFGWKSQHASLESFSADAYVNEMGITSPLFPEENTSSGRNVRQRRWCLLAQRFQRSSFRCGYPSLRLLHRTSSSRRYSNRLSK